jgi:hypothetical protein
LMKYDIKLVYYRGDNQQKLEKELENDWIC